MWQKFMGWVSGHKVYNYFRILAMGVQGGGSRPVVALVFMLLVVAACNNDVDRDGFRASVSGLLFGCWETLPG